MSERILVTGGAGFIGSHTVDALVQGGYDVRVLDNLTPQVHGPDRTRPAWLNPGAEYQFGDVRDAEAVARAVSDVDVIVHDAALVGVGQSQYAIREYIDVNVGGTANLLDVLTHTPNRVRRLLVASSMSIYGEGMYRCAEHGLREGDLRPDAQLARRDWQMRCPECSVPMLAVPTGESKSLQCASIYAQSKKDQEEYALIWGKTYRIPTIALRYFNTYGPRQSLNNPYTGVAAIFLSRLLNGQAPMIYEDGEQSRDFTSVHDIVAAKIALLENTSVDYGSFNIGTGRRTTVLEMAERLGRLLQRPIPAELVRKFRSGDIRDCYADNRRLTDLGWSPSVELDRGLVELAAWSMEQSSEDKVANAHAELLAMGLVA